MRLVGTLDAMLRITILLEVLSLILLFISKKISSLIGSLNLIGHFWGLISYDLNNFQNQSNIEFCVSQDFSKEDTATIPEDIAEAL